MTEAVLESEPVMVASRSTSSARMRVPAAITISPADVGV